MVALVVVLVTEDATPPDPFDFAPRCCCNRCATLTFFAALEYATSATQALKSSALEAITSETTGDTTMEAPAAATADTKLLQP